MTTKAREVLEDCRFALHLMEDETDLQKWRIMFVAAISLCRSVGYVLDKVDAASNSRIKSASKAAFVRWKSDAPEHEIFREFIDKERHGLLKEYALNFHPLDTVPILVQGVFRRPSGEESTGTFIASLDENIYRPMMDGFREGDDVRDVLSDAIDWWDGELQAIEKEVAAQR
jgi:hypothetical protein